MGIWKLAGPRSPAAFTSQIFPSSSIDMPHSAPGGPEGSRTMPRGVQRKRNALYVL